MALEDVIAERYQDYVAIEEVVKQIAKDYECSEEDALLVLSDAIRINSSRTFQGDFFCSLCIYKREKLGPERLDDATESEVLESLSQRKISLQEGLEHVIPF